MIDASFDVHASRDKIISDVNYSVFARGTPFIFRINLLLTTGRPRETKIVVYAKCEIFGVCHDLVIF